MNGIRRIRGLRLRMVPLLVLVATTCDADVSAPPVDEIGFGKAYDVWRPVAGDTCAADVHNRYSTVGPDGLRYPTWHPPTDPASGCTFGHEHGRDPRGSDLYGWMGDIPFGYANQVQDIADPSTMRHEDHVGHKIEWENDIQMHFSDGAGAVLDVRCDVLAKLHQGTHSKDAFTNNVHELVYAISCTDRTQLHITVLAAIGTPGEFVSACDRERHIHAGVPTPPTSPNGNGKRAIPDRSCIEQHLLVAPGQRSNYHGALHESWETHTQIKLPNGHTIASFDPYFQVFAPSRYFDAGQAGNVGRPIAACYEVQNGERAQGGACEDGTHDGALTGLAFDDARSPFNGVHRQVDINGNRINNPNGPEVWYTDPFGRKASTEAFPGAIRQFIARVDNTGRVPRGPTIGRNRDYGGPGVHAPN
jgi:hypothetical protein